MDLQSAITEIWENRQSLDLSDKEYSQPIHEVIDLLDQGVLRVAEMNDAGEVVVYEWIKQAILLLFQISTLTTYEVGPFEYVDKLPLKKNYQSLGVRVVPGASARYGSFIDKGAILMPSYVNIGAYVGAGTMVDTWATVGSCAQIGARVHLAGGVGIGGVLEPPNAAPVIIGDDALIGSRCMITQGARVGEGSVLAEGTILNPAIPVIDSFTGEEINRGKVPPWCVAIGAQRKREYPGGEFYVPCVLIIRHLAPGERHDKAQLNEILRLNGVSAS